MMGITPDAGAYQYGFAGIPLIAVAFALAADSRVDARKHQPTGVSLQVQEAFAHAYTESVRLKRSRRVLQGAVAGTATGAAIIGALVLAFISGNY